MPLAEAGGAILAHSQRVADGVLRKGRTLKSEDLAAMADAGLDEVTVARPGPEDVAEDEAAAALAAAVAGEGVRAGEADTGRANLFAEAAGLLRVDATAVNRLNAVDPALTLATLSPFCRVAPGRMVGTVKIMPFATPRARLEAALASVGTPPLTVARWRLSRVAAISTLLPTLKASVVEKTLGVFAGRLEGAGATIASDRRVAHVTEAVAAALAEADEAEAIVVFAASAVVDQDDVIPTAIRAAGGRVVRFGMPVDPGNLLVLGELGGRPVVGAPGCARSPKENGFDFVLDRCLAGIPVGADDIAAMGVGGLLTETAARPRPRRGVVGPATRPAALVLAAGRSTRMGANKLVEEVGGVPMVRRVVGAALASRAAPVVVVTGHEPERVHDAIEGLDVAFVHNAQHADGLSTSLRAGLAALPAEADAALVLLGDMPLVTGADCDAVLAVLSPPDVLIAIATAEGARGNPVAWSRALFPELMATEGDAGGRALLSRYADQLASVEIGAAARLDADTPAALADVRRHRGA